MGAQVMAHQESIALFTSYGSSLCGNVFIC
jgi:hypothetical protein